MTFRGKFYFSQILFTYLCKAKKYIQITDYGAISKGRQDLLFFTSRIKKIVYSVGSPEV